MLSKRITVLKDRKPQQIIFSSNCTLLIVTLKLKTPIEKPWSLRTCTEVTSEIQILMDSKGKGRYFTVAFTQSGSRLTMAKRTFLRQKGHFLGLCHKLHVLYLNLPKIETANAPKNTSYFKWSTVGDIETYMWL